MIGPSAGWSERGQAAGRFGGGGIYAGSDLLTVRVVPGFTVRMDEILKIRSDYGEYQLQELHVGY